MLLISSPVVSQHVSMSFASWQEDDHVILNLLAAILAFLVLNCSVVNAAFSQVHNEQQDVRRLNPFCRWSTSKVYG